jgi:hypothetical protein
MQYQVKFRSLRMKKIYAYVYDSVTIMMALSGLVIMGQNLLGTEFHYVFFSTVFYLTLPAFFVLLLLDWLVFTIRYARSAYRKKRIRRCRVNGPSSIDDAL